MWLDRLVIYLEKQIYRDTKFPKGANSLLSSSVDDTSEGAILLSLIFKCGWLAIEFMNYFHHFHLFMFYTFQKSKVAWGGVKMWQEEDTGQGFLLQVPEEHKGSHQVTSEEQKALLAPSLADPLQIRMRLTLCQSSIISCSDWGNGTSAQF